jgi:hypothetical protein
MELNHIREYICNNPVQWEMDKLNPDYRGECKGEKFFAPTDAPTEIRELSPEYGMEAWML